VALQKRVLMPMYILCMPLTILVLMLHFNSDNDEK
jgi:hypothetical protein